MRLNSNSAGLPHPTLPGNSGGGQGASDGIVASVRGRRHGPLSVSLSSGSADRKCPFHPVPPPGRAAVAEGALCLPWRDRSPQHGHAAPPGLFPPLRPRSSPTLPFSYKDETRVYNDLTSASVSQLLWNSDDGSGMPSMRPLKSFRPVSARGGTCRWPCSPLPVRPQRPS